MRRLPEMSYTSVRQDCGGVKMVVKFSVGVVLRVFPLIVAVTVRILVGLSATVIVVAAAVFVIVLIIG